MKLGLWCDRGKWTARTICSLRYSFCSRNMWFWSCCCFCGLLNSERLLLFSRSPSLLLLPFVLVLTLPALLLIDEMRWDEMSQMNFQINEWWWCCYLLSLICRSSLSLSSTIDFSKLNSSTENVSGSTVRSRGHISSIYVTWHKTTKCIIQFKSII